MSGYVIAGYAVTIGGLGAYVAWTLTRLRRLSGTAAAKPEKVAP